MSKEQLKVKIDAGVQELVIRHGDAEPIHEPNQIVVDGRIKAPIEYFQSRRKIKEDYFDLSKVIVLVKPNQYKVVLMADPTSKFGDVIEGQLFGNPTLVEFHLSDKTQGEFFTPKELAKVFRRNLRFFDNQDEARRMIHELNNLKVQTSGNIDKREDNRGNKTNSFEQSVESNVPVSFTLLMPVFEGEKPVRFQVDIFLEVTGSSVHCQLDSVQLLEVIDTESERILGESVKDFYDSDVTVVCK